MYSSVTFKAIFVSPNLFISLAVFKTSVSFLLVAMTVTPSLKISSKGILRELHIVNSRSFSFNFLLKNLTPNIRCPLQTLDF